MGALRKAGVWLGLVEDEDDRGYDERGLPRLRRRLRRRGRGRRGARRRLGPERLERAERAEVAAVDRAADRQVRQRRLRRELSGPGQPGAGDAGAGPGASTAAAEEDGDGRRYQITTLHPTTYNEARTIGEHFRDGVPVIMNLTEMDEADAKRLVDFAAGLVFGLRGNFERVTNRVFLLSPANVQVTAEDKAKIAEGGFFNQS